MDIKPGTVVWLNLNASPQFVHPVRFRIISQKPAAQYDDWIWLTGYQLDDGGNAVERREVFVGLAGLQVAG